MKKLTFLLGLLLWVCGTPSMAQSAATLVPNSKMGKPTMAELTMESYAPDSSAAAVVLYNELYFNYEWGLEDFRIAYRHKTRIKILKEEGLKYANVEIPYYEREENRIVREVVTGLNASSYNLEDGKTVRTKMKKEQVFDERLNNSYRVLKFTVPQAKVGSVIEYEYNLLSDLYYRIPVWMAQRGIPTLYTELEAIIPQYFKFNVGAHGREHLDTKHEDTNIIINIRGQQLHCSGKKYSYVGRELPAIKDDAYIWCADNYAAQVNMELEGYEIPGVTYKTFTQRWEDIDKILLEDSDFGSRTRMSNPLKNEMAALHLENAGSTEEKIARIYTLLKSKVKWNEKYGFYGDKGRQVLKEGSGSNAEINFILISMLKDAGIPAFPVVMSRRDQPMLPYSHPSIQKLSTFVVGIADTDSTFVYLDGSVRDGYINVIPPVLMTNRARIIMPNYADWVNLQGIGRNSIRSSVQASIAADGKISGTRTSVYIGQNAADIRRSHHLAKDSLDFIQKLNEREGIEVQSYGTKGLHDFSPTVQENLSFEKQAEVSGDYIYVNPLIFLHVSESPFKQSERTLPIEFSHQDLLNLNINLTIPEGYTVDELPESGRQVTSDGKITALYYIQQQGRQISVKYSFQLKQLLFTPESYPELKKFWEMLAEKNNAMMILKKQ